MYIYQYKEWPNFNWDESLLLQKLGEVRNLQGKIIGKMESLGFEMRNKALLDNLSLDVIKSTEIEGEFLNPAQVRSSIARRLGINTEISLKPDRDVEGMVDMMMDAAHNCFNPLSIDRLFDWHAALFPTGRSGMRKIITGNWRDDSTGPMQVVSGAVGNEKVHFQAPGAAIVSFEMERFIDWFNNEDKTDLVIKAAAAHIWFVTIHPFDDGNGRIARALTDMLLARSDKSTQRFYSMSAQIRIERKSYYGILEMAQKGNLNITDWIIWFLDCLMNALISTESILSGVLKKSEFWQMHSSSVFNERQRMMINKLFDGFEGNLTTSKWAKITKCSPDTALRDIQDLISKGVLRKKDAGGRSTNYELID